MRHSREERTFWVDALCVNQSDLKERAQQVSLMRSIFSDAACVYVWLGSDVPAIAEAVQNIKAFLKKRTADHYGLTASSRTAHDQSKEVEFALLEGMVTLTSVNWWSRLWPYQEVALAKQLVFCYDRETIKIDELEAFADMCARNFNYWSTKARSEEKESAQDTWMWKNFQSGLDKLRGVIGLHHLLDNAVGLAPNKKLERLLDVLHRSRRAQVADPRDRVYGILGILTALFGTGFMKPDYSVSVAEIYSQFAVALIDASGSLKLLSHVSGLNNSLTGLPSFAPDWTSFYDFQVESDRSWTWDKYKACTHEMESCRTTTYLDLQLRWRPITVVKHVSAVMEDHTGNKRWYRRSLIYEGWKEDYRKWATSSKLPGNGPGSIYSEDKLCLILCRGVSATTRALINSKEAANLIDAADAWTAIARKNSRFFMTSEGEPAVGPVNTQVGDTVALLQGGNVPYVLRRYTEGHERGRGGSRYYFIGEAYVYGAMDGEKCPADNNWETVTIV